MKSLISLALRLFAVGGKFVAMVVLARAGGGREVGAFALFFGAINVALFAIGFDFHLFAVRELLARRSAAGRARIILGQALFDGAVYAVILIVAAVIWLTGAARLIPMSLAWFVGILLLDHIAQEISRQFLVLRHANASNIVYAVKTGLWGWLGAGGIVAGLLPGTANSFYALWLISDVFAVAFGGAALLGLFRGVRFAPPSPFIPWVARGWSVSRYFYATSISSMCIAYVDRFIIARQVSLSEAGRFAFWQSITSLIPVVVYAMAGMHFLPRLVEAFQRRRHQEFAQLSRSFLIRTAGIAFMSGAFVIIGSFWIPSLLGKREFAASVGFIALLVAAATLNALWQVPYQVLYSAGRDRLLAVVLVGMSVLSIALDALLIPTIGIAAAAAVSVAVNLGLYLILASQSVRHDVQQRNPGWPHRLKAIRNIAVLSSPGDV